MLDVRLLSDPRASRMALADLAAWADKIDLAYAWASSSAGAAEHWRALPLARVRKAVLGIHFAQTEPRVLRELHDLNVLRVFSDAEGVFHPKVIIGVAGTHARALLGSSNLTTGGFAGNTEVNILLSGSIENDTLKQLLAFVQKQWTHPHSFEPDDAWFDAYEQLYENRPRPPKMKVRPRKSRAPRIIKEGSDLALAWQDFVELIKDQDHRSLWTDVRIHVFDHPDGSYLQEVESCQKAFEREPRFAKMSEDDRKLVAGWGERTAGCYGRMKGAGYFMKLTRERPSEIAEHLDKIPLRGNVTRTQTKTYLENVTAVQGVALGTATRLLCMKRPDLFLPANSASLVNIRRLFKTTPKTIEKYLALIDQIWQFSWFNAPRPKDTTEARIWRARVALLDAVFYEPPEYLK